MPVLDLVETELGRPLRAVLAPDVLDDDVVAPVQEVTADDGHEAVDAVLVVRQADQHDGLRARRGRIRRAGEVDVGGQPDPVPHGDHDLLGVLGHGARTYLVDGQHVMSPWFGKRGKREGTRRGEEDGGSGAAGSQRRSSARRS
nr:hypothetical protein GCM10020093_009680 [Planobispora longispora]